MTLIHQWWDAKQVLQQFIDFKSHRVFNRFNHGHVKKHLTCMDEKTIYESTDSSVTRFGDALVEFLSPWLFWRIYLILRKTLNLIWIFLNLLWWLLIVAKGHKENKKRLTGNVAFRHLFRDEDRDLKSSRTLQTTLKKLPSCVITAHD